MILSNILETTCLFYLHWEFPRATVLIEACMIMGVKPEGSLSAQFIKINIEQGYNMEGTVRRDCKMMWAKTTSNKL